VLAVAIIASGIIFTCFVLVFVWKFTSAGKGCQCDTKDADEDNVDENHVTKNAPSDTKPRGKHVTGIGGPSTAQGSGKKQEVTKISQKTARTIRLVGATSDSEW